MTFRSLVNILDSICTVHILDIKLSPDAYRELYSDQPIYSPPSPFPKIPCIIINTVSKHRRLLRDEDATVPHLASL